MTETRIYLDNAATSWPKPAAVLDVVTRYLRDNGAPAGRGAYRHALEVQQQIHQVRAEFAGFIRAPRDGIVVFTANGTDSLNLAIHGLLKPGDHVVTTAAEHNSVLRPLRYHQDHGEVEVTIVPCDREGFVDLDELKSATRPGTRLVALTHASNVTGAIQPIDDAIAIAHQVGARVLLDCAQSMGHVPFDVSQSPADLVACSAHKGLLGILGLGVLWMKAECQAEVLPIRQGGTGTQSDRLQPPAEGPERYEAGNLNVPGILALGAGLEFLNSSGEASGQAKAELACRLAHRLRRIQGVRVIGHVDQAVGPTRRFTEVVSVTIEGYEPQDFAAILDTEFGVQVRAGLHCAPLIHEYLETANCGGTVRFSLGPFTTADDVDAAIAAVTAICAA